MSAHRTVVHGGHVLTMDPDIGDLPVGDVLIEDGRIAAVGRDLGVTDAEVIDASGHFVLPGLIDTHRHTWQSLVRGICADWTLADYWFGMRLGISPEYTPEDVRLGNFVGATEALSAGVTTILDFSHCNNTPAHADGAVAGLRDAGIRAVFGYGFFESSPGSSRFGDHAARIADFHRVADTYFADEGLLTLGVALAEVFGQPWAMTVAELEAARARGALLVNHTGCVFGGVIVRGVEEMDALGLLGPDIVHVHCTDLGDADWERLARSGGKVSISVQTEMNMGFGRPVFDQCRRHGIAPTMSTDITSLNSGDIWHELRFGLACARADAFDPILDSAAMPESVPVTAREAMDWATVNAAAALGMSDRIGSLTPGKRADLQLVGGPALEQHPHIDPYGTLLFQTTTADVRTVLVDGRVVKRDGRLLTADLTDVTRRADAAAQRILDRVRAAGRTLPGTPPGALAAVEPLAQPFYQQAVAAAQAALAGAGR
ncbi:amidohydrolase family protein [Microbacterium immunditiarum]|uniref:Cytosine/adenosine deaminase-related metal-dependent hydrolase n=1 Tax=Microbacterium immunditiarum TaxID=337480 RepID=A0A7Y9GM61_9MICO|nr:amidohydrolase family protein [Microbacterium immunditiarum]NYE18987.1 cytosine/adenosine deaminase-related metal-dependent hydrolase [Microbacterium immunditiarum]